MNMISNPAWSDLYTAARCINHMLEEPEPNEPAWWIVLKKHTTALQIAMQTLEETHNEARANDREIGSVGVRQ